MFTIVWQFQVKAGSEPEFEAHYGPDGAWAKLFAASPAYRGTALFRDVSKAGVYLTFDHWRSEGDFEAFKAENGGAYQVLDQRCGMFTTDEQRLVAFPSST